MTDQAPQTLEAVIVDLACAAYNLGVADRDDGSDDDLTRAENEAKAALTTLLEQARQEGYEEGRKVEKTMEPIYRRDERNALLDELEAETYGLRNEYGDVVDIVPLSVINAKRKKGE